MPFAPSSFLLLVAMPGAPSSVLSQIEGLDKIYLKVRFCVLAAPLG